VNFDRKISISIILYRTHKKLRETKTTAVFIAQCFTVSNIISNKMSKSITDNIYHIH